MLQIHPVSGRNMREALERARDELGDEAVVLSHRASGEGITLAVSTETPRTAEALTRMRQRAKELLIHAPVQPRPDARAGTQDVERSLRAAGASDRLVSRICEAVAGRLPEGLHPLDLAGEELGGVFPVARSRRRAGTTAILAFLGPGGVGKTTTIGKLAGRMIQAGRHVLLATLDAYRVGSVEQTRAYGRHLGCPVQVLRDAVGLAAALADRRPGDVVLLDTTGDQRRDNQALEKLEQALRRTRLPVHLERYLVVSAAWSEEAIGRATNLVQAGGCIVTKLDETLSPGPALEYAVRRKLPIAFLADGPDLGRHLHRPTPERFADLMLRGRLS